MAAAAVAAVEQAIQQLLNQAVHEGVLDDQFLQLMQLQVRHWVGDDPLLGGGSQARPLGYSTDAPLFPLPLPARVPDRPCFRCCRTRATPTLWPRWWSCTLRTLPPRSAPWKACCKRPPPTTPRCVLSVCVVWVGGWGRAGGWVGGWGGRRRHRHGSLAAPDVTIGSCPVLHILIHSHAPPACPRPPLPPLSPPCPPPPSTHRWTRWCTSSKAAAPASARAR